MLKHYIIVLCYTFANAKEPELPLCPANIPYFPQNLPMHCRMPQIKVEQKSQPIQLPPGFQLMQGMQGLPGIQMPAVPGPPPQPAIPGLQPPPMQPMQSMLPMPGIPGFPAPMMPPKLPVVVMPYYSPISAKRDSERKHNRNRARHNIMYVSDETSDVDSNGSLSEEEDKVYTKRHLREKRRKLKVKKQMLTPLLQYVTKDGYVIYEKKISNGEAKKWLSNDDDKDDHNKETDSQEQRKMLRKFNLDDKNKRKILQARKMSQSAGKN